MNHALLKEAEHRRKIMLILMYRIRAEWVSAEYLRQKLACSKQQARRDIEHLENNRLVACCQLLDLREANIGVSDETTNKVKTSKTVIVRLTDRGRKRAETIPPWIIKE